MREYRQHDVLHFTSFDFFPKKLRRTPDHHANKEHGEDGIGHEVDKTNTVTTEHVVEHHLSDRNHSPEWC